MVQKKKFVSQDRMSNLFDSCTKVKENMDAIVSFRGIIMLIENRIKRYCKVERQLREILQNCNRD